MIIPPLIRSSCKERAYTIAGSSAAQLRAAMALLGPLRHGRRFGAYTDWEIQWRFRRWPDGAAQIEVELEACVTLPRWRPPRSAMPALVAEWQRYRSAMMEHERGHLALATECARTLAAELVELGRREPGPSAACQEHADAVMHRYREIERDYDSRTAHGANDGVVLGDE